MRYSAITKRIKRLIADNAGLMTGPGTNTYLIKGDGWTVIDPGPAIKSHIDNILKITSGDLKNILITHTHLDHSPAANYLHDITQAPVMGMKPIYANNQDPKFCPNVILSGGEVLNKSRDSIRVVHTPGHASNHLCFFMEEEKVIFAGDHIMNGSTVVIIPPDGNMSHYLQSLHYLLKLDLKLIAPGHGEIMDSPDEVIKGIIQHRLSREAKVIRAMKKIKSGTLDEILKFVYQDVDQRLLFIAKFSLRAHLLKLMEEEVIKLEKSNFSDDRDLWIF